MRKKHIYMLAGFCLAIGSGLGPAFEVMKSDSSSRADYEIVNIFGRKYIIFSSGGDIEVLNY